MSDIVPESLKNIAKIHSEVGDLMASYEAACARADNAEQQLTQLRADLEHSQVVMEELKSINLGLVGANRKYIASLSAAQKRVEEAKERMAVESLWDIEKSLLGTGYILLAERLRHIANSQAAWLKTNSGEMK